MLTSTASEPIHRFLLRPVNQLPLVDLDLLGGLDDDPRMTIRNLPILKSLGSIGQILQSVNHFHLLTTSTSAREPRDDFPDCSRRVLSAAFCPMRRLYSAAASARTAATFASARLADRIRSFNPATIAPSSGADGNSTCTRRPDRVSAGRPFDSSTPMLTIIPQPCDRTNVL